MNTIKKIFKNKKMLFSLGATTTISTFSFMSLACAPLLGTLTKYDSDNDGIVTIQTTWSSTGKQLAAIEKVVKKYNETQQEQPGYMPVRVQKIEGGYGTIPSQVITKIQSRDTKTLPNLYIDYPSAVGMIAPYKMLFNAGGDEGLARNLFEETFVGVNDKIAGVPEGGLYSIPLAKSTEGIIIDKVLMKYIFEQLESITSAKHQIQIDVANSPLIKEIKATQISPEDRKVITDVWGTVDEQKLPAGSFNFINSTNPSEDSAIRQDNLINHAIFKSYKSLFTFAQQVQTIFTNPGGANILGIDSPSNLIYNLSALYSRNDADNFLFKKEAETSWIKYSFLDNAHPASTIFKTVYKDFVEKSINTNSVWIGGGGAYGSERLKKHEMAISIGSSAGLNKAFDRAKEYLNNDEVLYSLPIDRLYSAKNKPKDGVAWENISSVVAQGPSFNTIHTSAAENKATIKFLKWFYDNQTYDFGDQKMSPTNMFAYDSSYIVPVKGAFEADSVLGKMVGSNTFVELAKDYKKQSLLGVKMSFETLGRQLKLSQTNDKAAVLDVPVGIDTGAIRKVIDSKMRASSNSFNSGASAYTDQQMWSKIYEQAIIDGVIDGTIQRKIYNYPNQLDRNYSDIDWDWYNYIDAKIVSWTDGDTPKVKVLGIKDSTSALKSIKVNEEYSIRVSGIDTPEAHIRLGGMRHFGDGISKPIDEAWMQKLIDHYQSIGTPLAVVSNNHYNALNYDYDPLKTDKANNNKRYGYWKSVNVDIQTPDLLNPDVADEQVTPHSDNLDALYNLRKATLDNTNLFSNEVLLEGYWGWRAKDFAAHIIPVGTTVRVATDGRKSYNRLVGSIFFDKDIQRSTQRNSNRQKQIYNANYSVEVIKAGLTLPMLDNAGAVVEPYNILWENGPGIADAFNYALTRPKQSDRSRDDILYDYAASHPNDPNANSTLLSYTGQYTLNGVNSYDSLDEWLATVLIIHGASNYSSLIRNSKRGETTIYDYLKYRNPIRERRNSEGATLWKTN